MGNVDLDDTCDEDESVNIFHAFLRIHDDLERDRNAFSIEPQFFSPVRGLCKLIALFHEDTLFIFAFVL